MFFWFRSRFAEPLDASLGQRIQIVVFAFRFVVIQKEHFSALRNVMRWAFSLNNSESV